MKFFVCIALLVSSVVGIRTQKATNKLDLVFEKLKDSIGGLSEANSEEEVRDIGRNNAQIMSELAEEWEKANVYLNSSTKDEILTRVQMLETVAIDKNLVKEAATEARAIYEALSSPKDLAALAENLVLNGFQSVFEQLVSANDVSTISDLKTRYSLLCHQHASLQSMGSPPEIKDDLKGNIGTSVTCLLNKADSLEDSPLKTALQSAANDASEIYGALKNPSAIAALAEKLSRVGEYERGVRVG